MRASLAVAPLAALLAVLASSPALAREELGDDLVPAKLVNASIVREARTALRASRTAAAGDTTYVGFVPGKVTPTNHWGIGTGKYRPYSSDPADYGYWSFDNDPLHDNIAEVHGDSLFGWWPNRFVYPSTGGLTLTDDNRPWWAMDGGNNANYVMNMGAAHKRTWGVVGVWHRDNGSVSGGGVTWSPLSGTHSLWCGLRRDGDLSFVDPLTLNPFHARILQTNYRGGGTTGGGTGTNQKYPGYGSQWDQMAYRDLEVGEAATLTLRFRYRTNMSTGRGTASNTRTGWFDKDPLQVTPNGAAAGNFISSSAAGNDAPIDSFMVYVGAPVRDSLGTPSVDGSEWFLASDGVVRRVYDTQRRWFSEVVRANEGLYQELFTTYGNRPVATHTTASVAIPASWGDRLRFVFRSKTNRGFDDDGGSTPGAYSSLGAGAVVLDDVEVSLDGGPYQLLGDFEVPGAVDNSIGTDPLGAWKTTGRPPAIYFHPHSISDLNYEDVCGPVGGALRVCDMNGNVISMGDHDNSEASGSPIAGTVERERIDGFYSPTINLRNGGGTNEMGINAAIATTTEDIYLVYEIYTGAMNAFNDGGFWYMAASAYPGSQSDGMPCWADWRVVPFVIFNPDKQCFRDWEPNYAFGMLRWNSSLAEGGTAYPDSIRLYLGKYMQCYRFGITTGCGGSDGNYFDNISIAFVDGSSPPLSVNLWDWIQDTFTVNGLNRAANPPLSAEFDTTSALVKIGLNIAQSTGNSSRYHVPGDTTAIIAYGDNVRMDLVFRISPGPGNYRSLGVRASGLRAVPTDPVTALDYALTGPGQTFERNFWARYLADNGAKGTPGGHPAGATNGGRDWSELVWNSARCDSAEINLWPIDARAIGWLTPGNYATIYHEADPNFAALGIAKNRCFLTSATAAVNQANTVCNIALTDGWPTTAGYVAENGLPLGQTYEYTKILPDGQFTPGTHVQYFLRREDTPPGNGPYLLPDTLTVTPQTGEGSTDAHRWQQFSVLPDAWKKVAYGGLGQACVLYVDLNDRRGNERSWVSMMDHLGGTALAKRGAHNGWQGLPGEDPNDPVRFVRHLNQQPGTTWDLYGVKASESVNSKVAGIGVDLSNHSSSYQIDNKWSFQGPSLAMLEAFYKVIVILTGDLNTGLFGPANNLGSNDVKMLQDFMLGGSAGDANHRAVWIQGRGAVESMTGEASNASLLNNFFHASLRDPSYMTLSGNAAACLDLRLLSPLDNGGNALGLGNGCVDASNVLQAGTGAVATSRYEPSGNASPAPVAGVYHEANALTGEYWQSLVDGWDIEKLAGRFCENESGRSLYGGSVLGGLLGNICTMISGPVDDVPNSLGGKVFVDYMNLGNNPLVTGVSTVEFGLAQGDRVEVRVFDVSGRLVRTLARRDFAAGEHRLTWDGADDSGRPLARGVYFTQVRYVGRGITEARKLTVLR